MRIRVILKVLLDLLSQHAAISHVAQNATTDAEEQAGRDGRNDDDGAHRCRRGRAIGKSAGVGQISLVREEATRGSLSARSN